VTTTELSPRTRTLSLATAIFTSLGVGFNFGFQVPLVVLILNRAGASSFAIGLVTGVAPISIILLGPAYPYMIARLGLLRAVLLGGGMSVAVLLIMPLFPGIGSWFVLRILAGFCIGLTWIASEVWMNSASTESARGTVMGLYGMVFTSGVVAGPIALGLTGSEGWLPFLVGAGVLCATLFPLLALHDMPQPVQETVHPRQFQRLLRHGPIVMLTAFVAGLIESADMALLPLFGLHSGLDEPRALAMMTVFLAGNVALQLPIGWCADKVGRRRMLSVCAVTGIVGPIALPFALDLPVILWGLLFVWGGLMYGFYTQGIALLGASFDERDFSGANTVFVMVYCVGAIVGPALGGYAMDMWMPYGLIALLSSAATILLVALLARRIKVWTAPNSSA
jgi:MFS family permease